MKAGEETESGKLVRARIVDFIRAYRLRNHAISPSLREIMGRVQISSTSITRYHIGVLIKEGRIGKLNTVGVARGLYLVDGSDIPKERATNA